MKRVYLLVAILMLVAFACAGPPTPTLTPAPRQPAKATYPKPTPKPRRKCTLGKPVSREQFGDAWPFTVEWGCVDCVRNTKTGMPMATFETMGKYRIVYGLNGHAIAYGFPDISDIWKDNPEIPGTKISIGPIIDLALEQCR